MSESTHHLINGNITHKNYITGGGQTVAIIAETAATVAGTAVPTYKTLPPKGVKVKLF